MLTINSNYHEGLLSKFLRDSKGRTSSLWRVQNMADLPKERDARNGGWGGSVKGSQPNSIS